MIIDVYDPEVTEYSVLNHFTDKLCEALSRLGVECRRFSYEDRDTESYQQLIESSRPDCTLSFTPQMPDDDGFFWSDKMGIPHINCMVDPPSHAPHILSGRTNINTWDDRFWRDFLRIYNSHQFFMPHAVEKELAMGKPEDQCYDVLMPCSVIDFEKRRESWEDRFPTPLCLAMDFAVSETFADPSLHFAEPFFADLEKYDVEKIPKLSLMKALFEIETQIKNIERIHLVHAITDASVHIVGRWKLGEEWQELLGSNVVFHDPLSFPELLAMMQKSKIILDASRKSLWGLHERMLTGLASGACVLTHENPYKSEFFKHGKSILYYRYPEISQVNDLINETLQNDSKRLAMAEKGREVVMQHHTWDIRANKLLQDVGFILKEFEKTK